MTATAKVLYLTDVWEERRPTLPEPPDPTKGLLTAAVEDAYAAFLQAVDAELDALHDVSIAGSAAYAAGAGSAMIAGAVKEIVGDGNSHSGYVIGWCHRDKVRVRPSGHGNAGGCASDDKQAIRQKMAEVEDAAETLLLARMLRADAKAAVFDAMDPAYPVTSSKDLSDLTGGDYEFSFPTILTQLRERGVEIRGPGQKVC